MNAQTLPHIPVLTVDDPDALDIVRYRVDGVVIASIVPMRLSPAAQRYYGQATQYAVFGPRNGDTYHLELPAAQAAALRMVGLHHPITVLG